MTKNTYTVAVFLYGEQDALATVTGQEAETVIRDFEAGRMLTFTTSEEGVTGTEYMPYHAIGQLEVTKTSSEVTVADEFCGGSDEGGSDEGGGE